MKDEIKKALEKATVGPWEFGVFEDSRHIIYDSTYLSRHIVEIVRGGVENEQREEDNAFLIANAPTWLRWQNERIEQLEKALNEITELGWSERFGGGYQYMGEYHAEAIKIARQALGKEE